MAQFPTGDAYAPTVGSSAEVQFRDKRVDFGKGYVQIAADGINNRKEIWTLTWDNLSDTDADTIATFLDTQGTHTPFEWTPPQNGATETDWRMVGGYTKTFNVSTNAYSISTTFEENFVLP